MKPKKTENEPKKVSNENKKLQPINPETVGQKRPNNSRKSKMQRT